MVIEEKIKRRDGKTVNFTFTKKDIWYWDLPDGKSLPLPDVDLSKAKTVKKCLDLIGKKRGDRWVGQVVIDLLNKDW